MEKIKEVKAELKDGQLDEEQALEVLSKLSTEHRLKVYDREGLEKLYETRDEIADSGGSSRL